MFAEFELKRDDLRAFNHFHHYHSPAMRRNYRRQYVVFPVVWLIICILIWYGADRSHGTPLKTFLDFLPLFSGVPFWLIYFPLAYRWKLRRIIAAMVQEGESRTLFTRHRVSISPEGISDATEFSQNSIKWNGVERVIVDGDYAFIYFNALAAIIVPKRAFATAAEFEQFVRTSEAYQGGKMKA